MPSGNSTSRLLRLYVESGDDDADDADDADEDLRKLLLLCNCRHMLWWTPSWGFMGRADGGSSLMFPFKHNKPVRD